MYSWRSEDYYSSSSECGAWGEEMRAALSPDGSTLLTQVTQVDRGCGRSDSYAPAERRAVSDLLRAKEGLLTEEELSGLGCIHQSIPEALLPRDLASHAAAFLGALGPKVDRSFDRLSPVYPNKGGVSELHSNAW